MAVNQNNDWVNGEWLNAQAGCIGCVCIEPKLAGRLLAETTAADFSETALKVYLAISALFSDGISPDAVKIGEKLGGDCNDYILQCMDIVPSVQGFPEYLRIVQEKGRMARVQEALLRASYAPTMDAMGEEIAKANELMVSNQKSKAYSISDLISGFYDRKQTAETYIQTGIRPLDGEMYLSAGDYMIIAGRPSRGKTVIALQMALAQAREYRVGFYSLETSKEKITDRILCHYAKVSMDSIKKAQLDEDEWAKVGTAATALSQYYHLEVVEAAGMSVEDIIHEALARRHEIIYIDYLQIIRGDSRKTRYDQVTDISIRLHTMAQKHKIMVVALSQLSRNSATAASEEPDMADLRESGQIEQDADAILMIYCKYKNNTDGARVLKIAKNKEGQLSQLNLSWDGKYQTLTPLSKRTPPPIPKTSRPIKPLPDDTPVPPEWEQTEMEEQKNA